MVGCASVVYTYTAGFVNKMAVSVTGPRAVDELGPVLPGRKVLENPSILYFQKCGNVHPMSDECWASVVMVGHHSSNIGCPYCVLSAIEKQREYRYMKKTQVNIITINNMFLVCKYDIIIVKLKSQLILEKERVCCSFI